MVSLKKILNKILVRINSEADYVVEQGKKNSWEYRKWNSGKLEYFSTKFFFASPGEAAGPLYRGEVTGSLPTNIPVKFNSTPSHVYAAPVSSARNIISINGYALDSTRVLWYIWTATSADIEVYGTCYLIGTWK